MKTRNGKVVLYARFSPRPNSKQAKTSDKKEYGECLSIEKQLAFCRKYCELHQYTVIGEFEDPDSSAATVTKRPIFIEAVDLACKKKAVLLGYDFSRLFRKVTDAILTSEKMEKAGAYLQAATGINIDRRTPQGRAFFAFAAIFAQLFREENAERTRDAMLYYQSQGRRMSHKLPYGWRSDPNDPARMLKHDGEQAVIQQMVALRRTGAGPRTIASVLAREGVRARNGKKFAHTTIIKILARNIV